MNTHPIDHAAAAWKLIQETVRELLIPCIIVIPIFIYFYEPSRMLTLDFMTGLAPYLIHWLSRKPERYLEEIVRYEKFRQNLFTYEE